MAHNSDHKYVSPPSSLSSSASSSLSSMSSSLSSSSSVSGASSSTSSTSTSSSSSSSSASSHTRVTTLHGTKPQKRVPDAWHSGEEEHGNMWYTEQRHLLRTFLKWRDNLHYIDRIFRGPPKARALSDHCQRIGMELTALQLRTKHPTLKQVLVLVSNELGNENMVFWCDRVLFRGDVAKSRNNRTDLHFAANTLRLESLQWILGYATALASVPIPFEFEACDCFSLSQSLPLYAASPSPGRTHAPVPRLRTPLLPSHGAGSSGIPSLQEQDKRDQGRLTLVSPESISRPGAGPHVHEPAYLVL